MPLLPRWLRSLRAHAQRHAFEADMDIEMRQHLEMEIDDLVRRGVPRDQATRQARVAFGGVERFKEEGRDARGLTWGSDLVQDVQFAGRVLRNNRGYAAVAILTLALGIGATTAIFGVVNGVLLKPMPYPHAERLLLLWDDLTWIGVPEAWVTGPEIIRLRESTRSFDGFAAMRTASVAIADRSGGEPEQLRAIRATANFFDILGARPALGRPFATGEDQPGAAQVAVISDGLWRRRYGGERSVIGQTIDLDGRATLVIGVLPRSFQFVMQASLGAPSDADVYLPLPMVFATMSKGAHQLGVLARVRDGVTPSQALSDLAAISKQIDDDTYGKQGFRFAPVPLRERLVRTVRPALIALLAAVGLLVLIMCANLATIALARTARREREFAVRKALGAARERIARQVLTETVVVSIAGAAVGIVLGWAALRGLLAMAPPGLPRRDEIGIDPTVVAFTFLLALLVGTGMSLGPMWYSARRDISRVMREKSASVGARGTRSALVLAQIALSLVLLAGTGLLLMSFVRLVHVDPGFDARGTLAVTLRSSPARYAEPPQIARFVASYVEQLAALPGVRAVGASSASPLSADMDQYNARFPDSPTNTGQGDQNALLVDYAVATPGYFAAMGIPLSGGGREFATLDQPNASPVAIIDDVLAKRAFPGRSAVGRRMTIFGDTTDITIVGVVRHVRMYGLQDEERGQVYRPHAQVPYRQVTVAIRGADDALRLAGPARAALHAIDPAQPISGIATMLETVARSLAERRLVLVLVASFAATALFLAALGVYGVTSTAVAQRTREIGIRVALGAEAGEVVWLMLRQPARLIVAGLVIGLIATVIAAKPLRGLLYDVSATDPLTLAGVSLTLAVVALVAAYLPARRATRVDPATVMRAE